MNRQRLEDLLTGVQRGEVTTDDALVLLRDLPFSDLAFAKPDHHRSLRTGLPEVIFGEGKSIAQIVEIAERLAAHGDNVLVTRLQPSQADALLAAEPGFRYEADLRELVGMTLGVISPDVLDLITLAPPSGVLGVTRGLAGASLQVVGHSR